MGRMTLVKAVLSAMPLHYIQAMMIPKCVIHHIDRLRRNFLWKGNESCKGINCLVNWETVCMMKQNGGMGIIDMSIQNQALLESGYRKFNLIRMVAAWPSTLRLLYNITSPDQVGLGESHSLKSLPPLTNIYACSVNIDTDTMATSWHWSADGLFSTSSGYKFIHNPGVTCTFSVRLWKLRVPTEVKIFIWLVVQNKLLTQEVLHIRGCPVPEGCRLCANDKLETLDHLLWDCPFSKLFWMSILPKLRFV